MDKTEKENVSLDRVRLRLDLINGLPLMVDITSVVFFYPCRPSRNPYRDNQNMARAYGMDEKLFALVSCESARDNNELLGSKETSLQEIARSIASIIAEQGCFVIITKDPDDKSVILRATYVPASTVAQALLLES